MNHPEKLGENTMRLLFVSLLHQDQHWSSLSELFKTWSENREGSNMLRGSLAYQSAILMITQKDLDRALYYNTLAEDHFLKVWPNFGSFANESKHEFLQHIQRNYELKEFLQLATQSELSQQDTLSLFRTWAARSPSFSYDSLLNWYQIHIARQIYHLSVLTRFNWKRDTFKSSMIQW